MYKNNEDIGYSYDDHKRFKTLKDLNFSSILDVGCGVCGLQKYLNDPDVLYHSYDVRKCLCRSHDRLPNSHYDLVCLFGVMTDKSTSKENYLDLLLQCRGLTDKYLVFSTVHLIQNTWLWYSKEETENIAKNLDLKSYRAIISDTETTIIGEV